MGRAFFGRRSGEIISETCPADCKDFPATEAPSNTTSPVVEALASSASGKKATKKGEKAPAKKVDCTPPYTTDENHVRRMKPECK